MNKRKAMISVLGILLIGGGSFLGTKAMFKDTEEVKHDLVVTTGSLELEVDNASPWRIVSEDSTEISNITDSNGFENVRPGDKFQKTITIENTGSLSQKLMIKEPRKINPDDKDKNFFEVKHNAIENIHNKILKPNESQTIIMTVSTKPEIMEKGKHEEVKVDLNEIVSPIIVEAKQLNDNN
ncbi:MAG: TasA family protein [Romboutsia sp.]